MRQSTSISFTLLLATGLFSAGGIAAPHGSSDNLVQRDTNLVDKRLTGQFATIGQTTGQERRSPQITDEGANPEVVLLDENHTSVGFLTTVKRFVNTLLARAVSDDEEQSVFDIAQENQVSGDVARDAASGDHHADAVVRGVMMARQFTNGTTSTNGTTPTNETVADPAVVLSRRNLVVGTTALFPRQYINGTTPTNRTVTGPNVVVSRGGTAASVPKRGGLVVRTAVVLPRQYTNGTGNGTDVVF